VSSPPSRPSSLYPLGKPVIDRVCVLGATGLLGTALIAHLHKGGYTVTAFSRARHPERAGFAYWNPEAGEIDTGRLQGADAVINLAGENIGDGRWTKGRKRRLRESRVASTELIATALARLPVRPSVLVNAAAVGYYGDCGDQAVYEDSPRGRGFLAELCEQWEAATAPAEAADIRVVRLRMGIVLARDGGALAKLLGPFKLGLGGRFGSGEQRMPWISITDAVGVIAFAMRHPELTGAVNVVAPESVTNAAFTETLAHVLGRPAALPVPAFVLKTALGAEMAQELLLGGANVRPRKLEEVGYRFEYPRLEDALLAILSPDRQTRS
jgi:uncharacterized protein (TIGR01777 family)